MWIQKAPLGTNEPQPATVVDGGRQGPPLEFTMQKLGLALVQIAAIIAIAASSACATAAQVKTAPPASADAEAAVRRQLAALEAKGPLRFETDTDTLDAEARDVLRQVAQQMYRHQRVNVVVAGHADERGDTGYNLALAERRADAARDFLARLGIPRSRVRTVSLGEEQPLMMGHDESAWAQNRRDEFTFVLPAKIVADGQDLQADAVAGDLVARITFE